LLKTLTFKRNGRNVPLKLHLALRRFESTKKEVMRKRCLQLTRVQINHGPNCSWQSRFLITGYLSNSQFGITRKQFFFTQEIFTNSLLGMLNQQLTDGYEH